MRCLALSRTTLPHRGCIFADALSSRSIRLSSAAALGACQAGYHKFAFAYRRRNAGRELYFGARWANASLPARLTLFLNPYAFFDGQQRLLSLISHSCAAMPRLRLTCRQPRGPTRSA